MTFIPDYTIYAGPEPITSIAFGEILLELIKLGNVEIADLTDGNE